MPAWGGGGGRQAKGNLFGAFALASSANKDISQPLPAVPVQVHTDTNTHIQYAHKLIISEWIGSLLHHVDFLFKNKQMCPIALEEKLRHLQNHSAAYCKNHSVILRSGDWVCSLGPSLSSPSCLPFVLCCCWEIQPPEMAALFLLLFRACSVRVLYS